MRGRDPAPRKQSHKPQGRRQIAAQKAAAPLTDSAGQLFQFLEEMPVAIFVLGADRKPLYANRAAQRILGQGIAPDARPEDLASTYRVYIAGTKTEYPNDRLPIMRAIGGESCVVDDVEIHHPDRVVPVEVWASPIRDANGAIAYAIAAFTDVSERKGAERRRAAEHAIVRTLVESESLLDVAPRILQAVCDTVGWDVGALWEVDREAGALRCVDYWHPPGSESSEFEQATRSMRFASGIGLPGRVW